MSKRINASTPFGEAFDTILHALAKNEADNYVSFGFAVFRKGDIRHIDVRMYAEATTNKQVVSKGHAHCTWTEKFYVHAACMDINTLLEAIETGDFPEPTPRRTFEEICKELAENPVIKGKWKADHNYAPRTFLLTNEKGIMLHMYDDGEVRFEPDIENGGYHSDIFTATELAAISAACTEIAANYAAEHGKEGV